MLRQATSARRMSTSESASSSITPATHMPRVFSMFTKAPPSTSGQLPESLPNLKNTHQDHTHLVVSHLEHNGMLPVNLSTTQVFMVCLGVFKINMDTALLRLLSCPFPLTPSGVITQVAYLALYIPDRTVRKACIRQNRGKMNIRIIWQHLVAVEAPCLERSTCRKPCLTWTKNATESPLFVIHQSISVAGRYAWCESCRLSLTPPSGASLR
jgi:hypothetical protein